MRIHLNAFLAAHLVLGIVMSATAVSARPRAPGPSVRANGLITGRSVAHTRHHANLLGSLAEAFNGSDGRENRQLGAGGPSGGFADKN